METVSLMDVIVETICNCNDFPEDRVQLQVIKALLTAVTSDHCNPFPLVLFSFLSFLYARSFLSFHPALLAPPPRLACKGLTSLSYLLSILLPIPLLSLSSPSLR